MSGTESAVGLLRNEGGNSEEADPGWSLGSRAGHTGLEVTDLQGSGKPSTH